MIINTKLKSLLSQVHIFFIQGQDFQCTNQIMEHAKTSIVPSRLSIKCTVRLGGSSDSILSCVPLSSALFSCSPGYKCASIKPFELFSHVGSDSSRFADRRIYLSGTDGQGLEQQTAHTSKTSCQGSLIIWLEQTPNYRYVEK